VKDGKRPEGRLRSRPYSVVGPSVSLRLTGGTRTSCGFELAFNAEVGGGHRSVSVLAYQDGTVSFPHGLSDSGESLGSDDLDAVCREEATALVVLLELLESWRRFSRGCANGGARR
jgi:hypothetical protein